MTTIKGFVFSGLLATYAARDMEAREQLAPRPELTAQDKDDQFLAPVKDTVKAASSRMQSAYRLMYVFENIVRELIADVLGEIHGQNWLTTCASNRMVARYTKRQSEAEKNQWHRSVEEEPHFYLDFGDLRKLIIKHWEHFEAILQDQSWVTSRLNEAQRCRNAIAHSRQLHEEDIDRLRIYVRDWINQVG